jgi:CubicO group peptidase (beta-lactamase class C family)
MNVQPTNATVDSIFERYIAPGSPGCALAVMKDGEIVYKQGYGLANLEIGVPILPSTAFNIGSMAKQFTAFAVALLEGEGKLSLDDDLRKHLPEMPDLGQRITIRHLIHHTSGLRDSFPDLLALAEWREADATSMEDVFRLLKAQRELNFSPGDEFLYTNSNYVLLALTCERVSGQPFAKFCSSQIFDPLGMARTVVNDSVFRTIPGRASGYYEGEGCWFNAPLADSVVGPTNVYTTVEDLARWDENFYSGSVGGRDLVERMHRPGQLNSNAELDYAFGLVAGPTHLHRGWQVAEHSGSHGGYSSCMVRFPELHLSVVVLLNHFLWGVREVAIKVADLFLEDKPGQQAKPAAPQQAAARVTLSVEQLREKAGVYFDAGRAALREVTLVEGRLQLGGLDLVPLSGSLFFYEVEPETQVEFILAKGEAPARMRTLKTSGAYGYDRVEAVSPSPDDLAQYDGRYYSPELDVYWIIVAGDGGLVARRRKYVDSRLTPLFADAFRDDWQPILGYPRSYTVLFERDEGGAIAGLRVSGTGVRRLWFARIRP